MRIALPTITINNDPAAAVRTITSIVNDSRGILIGKLLRVPLSQFVSVTAPASADTPFAVQHTLGRKPLFFQAQMDQAGNCYATPDDLREWSPSIIKIRCNVANAPLLVRIDSE